MAASAPKGRGFVSSTATLSFCYPRLSVHPRSQELLYAVEHHGDAVLLRLVSDDGTNRLTRARVQALTAAVEELATQSTRAPGDRRQCEVLLGRGRPQRNCRADRRGSISVRADGSAPDECGCQLPFPDHRCDSRLLHGRRTRSGARLRRRIARPSCIFGHRGAALGLITGWGGTQRLPRLIGKGRRVADVPGRRKSARAAGIADGLVDAIAEDPLAAALEGVSRKAVGRRKTARALSNALTAGLLIRLRDHLAPARRPAARADYGCRPRRHGPPQRRVAGLQAGMHAVLRRCLSPSINSTSCVCNRGSPTGSRRSCPCRPQYARAPAHRSPGSQQDFPGDPQTGILDESERLTERFEDFGNDEPCPVLDPATGTCDLYSARPMTCRVFGPPVRSEGGLGVCELCYHGASEEEIAACEMIADPDDMEGPGG